MNVAGRHGSFIWADFSGLFFFSCPITCWLLLVVSMFIPYQVSARSGESAKDEEKASYQYRFRLATPRSQTGTPPHEDKTSQSPDHLSEAQIKANQKKVMEYIESLRRGQRTIGLPETVEIYYLAEDYRVVHGLLDQDFITAAESVQIGKSRQALLDEALDSLPKKGTTGRLLGVGVNDFGSGAADPDAKTDIDITLYGDRSGSEIIKAFRNAFSEVTRKYGRSLEPGQTDIVAHRHEGFIPDWRQTRSVSSFTAKLRKGTEYLKANKEAYFLEGAYVQQIMGRSVEAKDKTFTEISLSEEGVVVRTKKYVIDVPGFFYKPEIRARYGWGGAVGNWHFWHAHADNKAAASKYLLRSVDNGKRLTIEADEARRGDYETLSKQGATKRVKDMYGRQFDPESLRLIQAVLDTAVNIRKLKKDKALNLSTEEGKMKAYGPIIEFERSRSPIAMSDRELILLAVDRYERTSKKILIQNNIDTAPARLADWAAPRVPERPQISIDENGEMTTIKADPNEARRLNIAAFFELRNALALMDPKQISEIQRQNPRFHNDIEILKRLIEAQNRMLDGPESLRTDETFAYKEKAVRAVTEDFDRIKTILESYGRGPAFLEAGRTLYNRGVELENWFQREGFTILEKKHGGNALVARFAKLRTAADIVNERLETRYDPYLREKTTTLLNSTWMMRMNLSTSLMEVAKSYLSEGELNWAVLTTALYQGLGYVPFLGTLMTVQSGRSGVATLICIQFVPGYGQLITLLNLGRTGVELAGMAIFEPLKSDKLLEYYQGYRDPEEGGLITSGQRVRVESPMPALLHPVDPDRSLPLDERREKMYHYIQKHVEQMLRQDPDIWYHPEKAPEIWFGPERLGFKNLHEEFQAKELDYMSAFVDAYVEDWWNGQGIFSASDEILAARAKGPDLRNELKNRLKQDYIKGKNIAIQKEIQRQEARWAAVTEEMAQIGGMNVALDREMESMGGVFLSAGKAAYAEVLEEMPVLSPGVEIIASPRVQEVESLDPEKNEKEEVVWNINFRAKITGSTKTNPAPWKVVWEIVPVGGPAVRFEKENDVRQIYKKMDAPGQDKYFSEGGRMQVVAKAIDANGKEFAKGTLPVEIEKSRLIISKQTEPPVTPEAPKEGKKEDGLRTAPVLKLVKIEGPAEGPTRAGFKINYKKGSAGYSMHRRKEWTGDYRNWDQTRRWTPKLWENEIASLKLSGFPVEIAMGEPFSVDAELKMRHGYSANHECQEPQAGLKDGFTIEMGVGPIGLRSRTLPKTVLQSHCDQKTVCGERFGVNAGGWIIGEPCRTGNTEKDERISINGRFVPVKINPETGLKKGETRLYRYRLERKAADTAITPEGDLFADWLDHKGEYGSWNELIITVRLPTLHPEGGGLRLFYRPVPDNPVGVADYDHPEDLISPPRNEPWPGNEEIAKKEKEGDGSRSSDAWVPGDKPIAIDPNANDPKDADVSRLIREWISTARPPENAVKGNNVRYSNKGNVVGKVRGGVIESRHETGGIDPVFLWTNKKKLDSVDHCTMEEYVVARLKKESIRSCAGRYGAVRDLKGLRLAEAKAAVAGAGFEYALAPGSPAKAPEQEGTVERQEPGPEQYLKKGRTVTLTVHSPFVPAAVVLPDFTGKPLGEARKWLEKNKLASALQPGSPAPTAGKSGTVEKQGPAPGSRVEAGETVTLTVHSDHVDLRTVPNLVGLSAGNAQKNIAAAGLTMVVQPGGQPSTREQAGTVERQRPDPGTTIPPGAEVTLIVYAPYVETRVVPDVRGLSYPDARARLEAAGFMIDRREGGKPAERRLADTAQRQEPAAGTKLSKGQAVPVWFYGPYTPTREEQVAATDCSGYPGSRASWDNSAGQPLCGCFDGLAWNLANTRCVTAEVRANELCARDLPGSVAQGKTPDGKINCVCPQGYTWDASQNACEKLIPPEELCTRNYPGSVPTGRDGSNKVICDCPQGYVWTADKKRCVQSAFVRGVVREVHMRGGQARFGAIGRDGRIGGPHPPEGPEAAAGP